jgi:hypothetical protein
VSVGPLRNPTPVDLARRLAVGIGLTEVRALEQRVAAVAECVAENSLLARALEAQVARLEAALVPVLEKRSARRPAG